MAVGWQTKAGEAGKTEVKNKSGFISAQKNVYALSEVGAGELSRGN